MNTIENSEKPIVKYRFPKDILKLKYSQHAKDRLVERTTGSLILAPNYLRITPNNALNIKEGDGGIKEVTVRIGYKRGIDIYLIIAMPSGVVKTVYFKNVKKKHKTTENNGYRSLQAHKAAFGSEIFVPIPKVILTEPPETIRENREFCREREDVDDVLRDMEREKTFGWKELFRAIRGIFRKRAFDCLF